MGRRDRSVGTRGSDGGVGGAVAPGEHVGEARDGGGRRGAACGGRDRRRRGDRVDGGGDPPKVTVGAASVTVTDWLAELATPVASVTVSWTV